MTEQTTEWGVRYGDHAPAWHNDYESALEDFTTATHGSELVYRPKGQTGPVLVEQRRTLPPAPTNRSRVATALDDHSSMLTATPGERAQAYGLLAVADSIDALTALLRDGGGSIEAWRREP